MKKLLQFAKATTIVSLGSLLITPVALAQTESTGSSVGLEVSAPIYEFTVKPGESIQDIVKIRNRGDKASTYYPQVVDFRSNNVNGEPDFLEAGEENGTYSLVKWLSFTKESVTLDPLKSEAFIFTINVPANAEPGGHYGAILFSSDPTKLEGTGLGLRATVGSLILVRVAGNAKESAKINEFKSDKGSYNKTDVKLTTNVENTGNVHLQPKGVINIKNMFGGQVASVDVNSLSANVLPGSKRVFESTWKDPGFKLGLYTATVVLTYGDPAQTITSQVSFWILPWTTILITLAIIILVIILLVLLLKQYNRWIVSKALNKQS